MIPASPLFDSYNKAQELLAQGDLRSAADLCKQMLEVNPNFAHGYHLMSSLFRNTGNLDKALNFSQLAIRIEPLVAAFHFQQGQVLFALSDWKSASVAFEQACTLDKKNAIYLLLWADTLVVQQDHGGAQALFTKARKLPYIPEMDEHEGIFMMARGDMDGAEKLFNRLIAKLPNHASGYLQKGKILLGKQQTNDAQACFARALNLNPSSQEALHYMGLIAARGGDIDGAMQYIMQAVQVNTPLFPSIMLLCVLLVVKREYVTAENLLRQALTMRPDNVEALQALVNVLIALNRHDEALTQVNRVLAADPGNKSMRYFHDMLMGNTPDAPPPEYVMDVFNGCAKQFDDHLQKALGYHIPTLITDMLMSLPSMQNRQDLSLLDLGCGTGLVAEALKPITRTRIGVDLSEKMLEIARAKQLYDVQYTLDIVEYMNSCDRTFDIVAAADVLIYVGNPRPFMQSARNVLGSASVLVFTTELEEGLPNFRLNNTGRYSHSHDYIKLLIKEEGYRLLQEQECVLRMERGAAVKGMVYMVQKLQLH